MTDGAAGEVKVESRGTVRLVTLDRPAAKNSLTLQTVEALHGALDGAETDADTRAVVLSGVPGAFCSGADLRWLLAALGSTERVEETIDRFQALVLRIVELPKPVVAAVTGPAVGFGADLALACDFRVFGESAYLQEKFVGIGLMPDGGGSYFLTQLLGRARATELLMLGTRIDAAEALAWGLARQVVADSEVLGAAVGLATLLAGGPPRSLERIKRALHGEGATELRRALSLERQGQLELLQTEDVREGVRAFLERRSPRFTGR